MPELVGKFRDTGLVEVKKEVLNREQGLSKAPPAPGLHPGRLQD